MRIRNITRRVVAALAAVAALWPAAASAEWRKAETDRFIVYGEGREGHIRDLALRLSAYDHVLRAMNPTARPASDRKFEVYVLRSSAEMLRVVPGAARGSMGVYIATPQGVFALMQESPVGLESDDLLFHEYAHHFMLENFPVAYPSWFIEGWAEYFMTTEIKTSGVKIGGYNENRVFWLFNAAWVPMESVLGQSPAEIEPARRHLFYSQAWLLTHYMLSDQGRAAQLEKALAAIAAGQEPVSAFTSATGISVDELTKALHRYNRLPTLKFNNPSYRPPEVVVSALPPSAADVLLENLRLLRDEPGPADPAFVEALRRKAARWPGDRLAELTLARAEFRHGDVRAGEAIVERRLAVAPDDVEALFIAGAGQLTAAERDPASRPARARAARPYLIKAYGLYDGDYRLLLAYVASRIGEAAYPNDNDLSAALTARGLAPSVDLTSLLAGDALLRRGRRAEGVRLLNAVANAPHGGPLTIQARALLAGKTLQQSAAEAAEAKEEEAPDDGGEPQPAKEPSKAVASKTQVERS